MIKNYDMQEVAQEVTRLGMFAEQTTAVKNGKETPCIIVKKNKDDGVGCTFWPWNLAEDDDAAWAAARLAKIASQALEGAGAVEGSLGAVKDPEYILKNVKLRVCGREGSSCPDGFEGIPGTDLMLYAAIPVDIGEAGAGSVRVTDSICGAAGLSFPQVMDAARRNGHYCVEGMNEVLVRMMVKQGHDEAGIRAMLPPETGVVISNDEKLHGAAAISDPEVLEEARRFFGSETLMVFPSSIHEVIGMPGGRIDPEAARAMVADINRDVVKPEEKLTDSVYCWDGRELSMLAQ